MNTESFVKHSYVKTVNQGQVFAEYDSRCIENFDPAYFSANYWADQEAIITTAQGRGTTYFVQHEDQQWVLRHYYRGGLIGKIIHDSYFFSSWQNTRAAKEFHLLQLLEALQLPAPKGIAYLVKKNGWRYQADILTARIEQANDLVAILKTQPLDESIWFSIGQTIAKFHHQGIYHHDLNAHNVLIDGNNKVWLIDFDQGEQRQVNTSWQQSNMERLLRSFKKEQAKHPNFEWAESDWNSLLRGYQTTEL